ncbi:hypothetical protein RIF29_13224 [Crotalaria pallida]|uniref:Uncharacterized protein n=1 Tax=Crotalaria pallida TaxID=3830 RepID=A0AAN9IP03_CROPI
MVVRIQLIQIRFLMMNMRMTTLTTVDDGFILGALFVWNLNAAARAVLPLASQCCSQCFVCRDDGGVMAGT